MKTLLTTVGLSIPLGLFAQHARPNLTSFPPATLSNLQTWMSQYITSQTLEDHCNYQMVTGQMSLDIHSDNDFLPFHRAYIEGLEDFLVLNGAPNLVPFPYWDPEPAAGLPSQLWGVDANCPSASAVCMHGVSNNASLDCGTSIDYTPNKVRPSYLKLPVIAGANNDLCDFPLVTGSSGFSRVIEGEFPNIVSSNYHNNTHGLMGGAMGYFTSPGVYGFWPWHGYVDDIWKQKQCNCPSASTVVDLYMKDTPKIPHAERDLGAEPNIDTGPMWVSEDIWVRNAADGFTTDVHQNPEYSPSIPNYVYVRVRNRGCVASLGTETLSLHWAKAATSLNWPSYWNGTTFVSGVSMGNVIGTQTIPVIAPGDQVILQFPWNVPNPSDYNIINTEPWHFCLLARVVAGNDPMTFAETASVYSNTKNNNNIVWKNLTVVDLLPMIGTGGGGGPKDVNMLAGVIAVGNSDEKFANTFNITVQGRDGMNPMLNPILIGQAEVRLKPDDHLWKKLLGGKVKITNAVKVEKGYDGKPYLLVKDFPVRLEGIEFAAAERHTMNFSINFLTEKVHKDDATYWMEVIQTETTKGEPVGGERYQVNRDPARTLFSADAGTDISILPGTKTVLSADNIGEPAQYYWYDENDVLVGSSPTISVSPTKTTTYRVEILAIADGYKDVDEVTVNVNVHIINHMNPNPASHMLNVSYETLPSVKVELKISEPGTGAIVASYSVPAGKKTENINVSSLKDGLYAMLLVVDGAVADSKLFVKN